MTAEMDRQHVRFLGAVITVGFMTVAATLAVVFANGAALLFAVVLPLATYVLAAREELDVLEETTPTAATDGGLEVDSSTETGGDRNRRHTN